VFSAHEFRVRGIMFNDKRAQAMQDWVRTVGICHSIPKD